MMNGSGWDARRRNRNIGTSKSGHGQNNRLTIPQSWADDRLFHEKLNNPVSLELQINENKVTILIEETHPDYFHACTPDDIERAVKLVPGVTADANPRINAAVFSWGSTDFPQPWLF